MFGGLSTKSPPRILEANIDRVAYSSGDRSSTVIINVVNSLKFFFFFDVFVGVRDYVCLISTFRQFD